MDAADVHSSQAVNCGPRAAERVLICRLWRLAASRSLGFAARRFMRSARLREQHLSQGCNCSLALPHARSELALPQSTPGIHTSHQQRARQATMRRRAAAALLLQQATALLPTPSKRGARTLRRATETTDTDFADAQWQLYAAQSGRWEGVWTTFDSQGIEQLAHTGCWDVSLDGDDAVHKMEVPGPDGYPRQIPVGTYTKGKLGRQTCAGAGMVSGPTLLSGLMSTELLLRYGASRLRVAVQHAPAEANEASRTRCQRYSALDVSSRGSGATRSRTRLRSRSNKVARPRGRFTR